MSIITFLNALIIMLGLIVMLGILLIIIIGIDLAYDLARDTYKTRIVEPSKKKARHRRLTDHERRKLLIAEKEKAAREGFFEDPYVRGFDPNGVLAYRGSQVLTPKGLEYYKIMDKLADDKIFQNTEVL